MIKVAKFEKVTFEQYQKDIKDIIGDEYPVEQIKKIYERIQLPRRISAGSAGYNFYIPFTVRMLSGNTVKIPTGIRVRIVEGWMLQCYPASGIGSKYRLQLDDTVGIIDRDYYFTDNEGHIFAKITDDSRNTEVLQLKAGSPFMQGIFVQYGITEDDDAEESRKGSFGNIERTHITLEEYIEDNFGE